MSLFGFQQLELPTSYLIHIGQVGSIAITKRQSYFVTPVTSKSSEIHKSESGVIFQVLSMFSFRNMWKLEINK